MTLIVTCCSSKCTIQSILPLFFPSYQFLRVIRFIVCEAMLKLPNCSFGLKKFIFIKCFLFDEIQPTAHGHGYLIHGELVKMMISIRENLLAYTCLIRMMTTSYSFDPRY